jgi:hypothetical protein
MKEGELLKVMDKIVYEIDADNVITFIKPKEELRIEKFLNDSFSNELIEEN